MSVSSEFYLCACFIFRLTQPQCAALSVLLEGALHRPLFAMTKTYKGLQLETRTVVRVASTNQRVNATSIPQKKKKKTG